MTTTLPEATIRSNDGRLAVTFERGLLRKSETVLVSGIRTAETTYRLKGFVDSAHSTPGEPTIAVDFFGVLGKPENFAAKGYVSGHPDPSQNGNGILVKGVQTIELPPGFPSGEPSTFLMELASGGGLILSKMGPDGRRVAEQPYRLRIR